MEPTLFRKLKQIETYEIFSLSVVYLNKFSISITEALIAFFSALYMKKNILMTFSILLTLYNSFCRFNYCTSVHFFIFFTFLILRR